MPDNESGLSCLQSACVKGDTETVYAILNNSPDKLDSAIALSLKTGENVSRFNSQSILTVLGALDSENHKQISNLVEKVAKDFQSQSLLHIAAKKGNIEHIRRLLDFGEFVDCAPPDKSGETPQPGTMLRKLFNFCSKEALLSRSKMAMVTRHCTMLRWVAKKLTFYA